METLFVLNENVKLTNNNNLFFVYQEHKKIIINETVFSLLKQFEEKVDINKILKENSQNCKEKRKVLKIFYENMYKLGFIIPYLINSDNTKFYNKNFDLINNYRVDKIIYEGGNTLILLCLKEDKKYIIKTNKNSISKKSVISKIQLKNEYKILKRLFNKYIINVFDYFEQENNAFLVLEYFESENLNTFLKNNKLDLNSKFLITFNIIKAYSYIHSKNILHGDIHDKNILICRKTYKIKLIDFEFSKSINDFDSISKAGVDLYSPPERMNETVFNKFNELNNYNSEVYQLGLIIYLIYYDRLPFNSKTWKQLKMEKEKFIFKEKTNIDVIDNILFNCLNYNPLFRFNNAIEIEKTFNKFINNK